jgi:hypothetical protein
MFILFLEVQIMKKYVVSTIAVLVILAVTLSLYAQPGGGMGGGQRGGARGGGMMGRGGFRGFIRDEDLDNAIATIEKSLASLKKAKEITIPRPEGGFQDMTEEERTKMMEAMQKRGEVLQSATEGLEQQVMVLKGGFQLRQELQTENEELQAIADSAEKAKDTATAKLVQDLIAKRTKALDDTMQKLGIRGGMRGGRMGGGMGGQRGGGQRGGQGGGGQQ